MRLGTSCVTATDESKGVSKSRRTRFIGPPENTLTVRSDPMPKFFVQSGTFQSVVEAESSRKAALWAVHQAMRQILPVDDHCDDSPEAKSESASAEGVQVLGHDLRVSRSGFAGGDAVSLPTIELVNQWNEMVAALDRLERMIHPSVTAA